MRATIRELDGPRAVAKAEFPLEGTNGTFTTGRIVGEGVMFTMTLGIAELMTSKMANSTVTMINKLLCCLPMIKCLIDLRL